MKKFLKQAAKVFLFFLLSGITISESYSHKFWNSEFDRECDDGHSTFDEYGSQESRKNSLGQTQGGVLIYLQVNTKKV